MTNSELAETQNDQLNVEYYGADFTVELLVKRIEEGDFIIPGFQRKYVWKERDASRFIESLLIGLPTPSLFFAKDKCSNQYIVIDGQQRLRTLQYFYEGCFPDGKEFKLKRVIPALDGLNYSSLSLSQRRALNNSIIHCIIISENYNLRGMYSLFERLNTTGNALTPQEIRNAIYHGSFSKLLQELSENEIWKSLYPKDSNRAEAQELILRFLALHYDLDNYTGNMVDFLNKFMIDNQDLDIISRIEIENIFLNTVEFLDECIGELVFAPKGKFKIALFETVTLLVSEELEKDLECKRFEKFYSLLISNEDFRSFSEKSTTSKKNLIGRIQLAREIYQSS